MFSDMVATVVSDLGGPTLNVQFEGELVRWAWHLDGETCRVLRLPSQSTFTDMVVADDEHPGMLRKIVRLPGGHFEVTSVASAAMSVTLLNTPRVDDGAECLVDVTLDGRSVQVFLRKDGNYDTMRDGGTVTSDATTALRVLGAYINDAAEK
jgi:hypothetical protein